MPKFNWPRVILIGDSLTQFGFSTDGCWTSMLADALQRKCDVINRGFSGYNSRNVKNILPQFGDDLLRDPENVSAITVFLGANDANDPAVVRAGTPNQNVPLPEYEQNLNWILNFLEEKVS